VGIEAEIWEKSSVRLPGALEVIHLIGQRHGAQVMGLDVGIERAEEAARRPSGLGPGSCHGNEHPLYDFIAIAVVIGPVEKVIDGHGVRRAGYDLGPRRKRVRRGAECGHESPDLLSSASIPLQVAPLTIAVTRCPKSGMVALVAVIQWVYAPCWTRCSSEGVQAVKLLIEFVIALILHPLAVVLAWINIAGRSDMGFVQKVLWAIVSMIWGVGPILYILLGEGQLW
jgi:hypothetical protein